MLTVNPGSTFSLKANDRTFLLFAFEGKSQVGGVSLEKHDALRLDAHESAEISVPQNESGSAEFFLLELPRYD
jgi:hypothetical protein